MNKFKARFHEGPKEMSLCGLRTYRATQSGIVIAEAIAADKKEGKALLEEKLIERFAPGRGVGLDTARFKVVWC